MGTNLRDFLAQRFEWCCSNIPLLLLGSGFSLSYGLPSMGRLGTDLIEQLRRAKHVESRLVDQFELEVGRVGFEAAVDRVDGLRNHLDLIIQSIHAIISNGDQSAYENIVLENNPTPFQELLLKLKSSFNKPLIVITTNYDRIVEYECGRTDIQLHTGFSQSYRGRYSDSQRSASKTKFSVDLYKVHGSVDWYIRKDNQEEAFLPLTRSATPQYAPLIIVPGESKFLATDQGIHRRIKSAADEMFKHAPSVLTIGYGFRDPHIHDMLLQRFRDKRLNSDVVVLARTLSDEAKASAILAERYLMVERASDSQSRVFSNEHDGVVLDGTYWNLEGLMELYR